MKINLKTLATGLVSSGNARQFFVDLAKSSGYILKGVIHNTSGDRSTWPIASNGIRGNILFVFDIAEKEYQVGADSAVQIIRTQPQGMEDVSAADSLFYAVDGKKHAFKPEQILSVLPPKVWAKLRAADARQAAEKK
jgi:hypothetical protein